MIFLHSAVGSTPVLRWDVAPKLPVDHLLVRIILDSAVQVLPCTAVENARIQCQQRTRFRQHEGSRWGCFVLRVLTVVLNDEYPGDSPHMGTISKYKAPYA